MKYLATDLDGTLMKPLRKYSYVSKINKDALKVFKNNVIIVSGRNQPFVKNICKELGIKETFVACNGASIYLDGKEIFLATLTKKVVLTITDYVTSKFSDYKIIIFDTKGKLYSFSDNTEKSIATEKEYRKRLPTTSYLTNKNIKTINMLLNTENAIVKMNVATSENNKKELYEYLKNIFPDLSYSLCINSLEVTASNCNKGKALIKLTNAMKLKNEDVYVIGDDNNDITMFEEYKNSFLVKSNTNNHLNSKVLHVLEKFKDIANYIKED